jgi:hypothetical protein
MLTTRALSALFRVFSIGTGLHLMRTAYPEVAGF